jgi:hypothetical protein
MQKPTLDERRDGKISVTTKKVDKMTNFQFKFQKIPTLFHLRLEVKSIR